MFQSHPLKKRKSFFAQNSSVLSLFAVRGCICLFRKRSTQPRIPIKLFSGVWGKMIHEKNWSKKLRDTVPLKQCYMNWTKQIWLYQDGLEPGGVDDSGCRGSARPLFGSGPRLLLALQGGGVPLPPGGLTEQTTCTIAFRKVETVEYTHWVQHWRHRKEESLYIPDGS